MPLLSKACHHLVLSAGLAAAAASGAVHAEKAVHAEEAIKVSDATDVHAWLEDVRANAADLGQAAQRQSEAELPPRRSSSSSRREILAILDSDAKIPGVDKIGEHYYNFWKDKQHPRGLWRRTTLAEYRKAQAGVGNRDRPRRARTRPRAKTGSGTAPTASSRT